MKPCPIASGLACCLAAFAIGCEGPAASAIRLNAHVVRPARSAVIFFVDGMDRRHFKKMLHDGRLPNIEKRFVRGGVCVDHAITSMPAITYSNAVSLLTGVLPGHHGILGNQWFDRYSLKYQDYTRASTYRSVNEDFDRLTLYELLNDRFTINVQCHTRRGASHTIDHWAKSGIDWFFGNYIGIDRRAGETIRQVVRLANHQNRWPDVLMFYFPGVDMVGHDSGVDSLKYRQAMQNVDLQIGRIVDMIDRSGLAGSTYLVLVTDHGHVQKGKGRSLDLVKWLKKHCRLNVHQRRIDLAHRPDCASYLDRHDVVVVNGAYRRIAIHVKGPLGWSSPAQQRDIERIVLGRPFSRGPEGERAGAVRDCTPPFSRDPTGERVSPVHNHTPPFSRWPEGERVLVDQPAVGLVCYRDGTNHIMVVTPTGDFVVQRRFFEGAAQYRLVDAHRNESKAVDASEPKPPDPAATDSSNIITESDPLGYRRHDTLAAFIDAGWHGSRQWLAATAATDYPDFVPQVAEMFDSPRAGDLVVFAADDWSFDDVEPSGHGSCLKQDMCVPMYFAGPNLPHGGRLNHARLVDVMPTILDWLGESARLKGIEPIDGISLAKPLSAAPQIDKE